eukprot:660132_1
METIGKDIKHLLTKRGMKEAQFNYEVVLKDNLEPIGCDEIFLDRLTKLFLIFKNNRSPIIAKKNRKTKVSQVIDRYLFDHQLIQEECDDIMNVILALFKQHNIQQTVSCSFFVCGEMI